MTVQELEQKLSKVSPDTEIVGGMFNGRVNTYTVIDDLRIFSYDDIYTDFYGTPGAFDDKLLNICSKKVVYLGSTFDSLDKQVQEDRRVICQMQRILRMHRSKEWKKEQMYKLLQKFFGKQYNNAE